MMAGKPRSERNWSGGFNHYDEKGHKVGHSEKNIWGGYTEYDAKGKKIGRSDPNLFGGYTHYDAKGHKTGRSDPSVSGRYKHYDAKGHKTGYSDPTISGGYKHSNSNEGCYIATCVYGSYDCPEVLVLRHFRDTCLKKTLLGRLFIQAYYAVSPTIVKVFGGSRAFRSFWRVILNRIVDQLRRNNEFTSQEGIEHE